MKNYTILFFEKDTLKQSIKQTLCALIFHAKHQKFLLLKYLRIINYYAKRGVIFQRKVTQQQKTSMTPFIFKNSISEGLLKFIQALEPTVHMIFSSLSLMLWLSTKRSSCDSNYSTFRLPWVQSLQCPSKNVFLFFAVHLRISSFFRSEFFKWTAK